ncbi:hypothetical protein [Dyadobacter chenhuakuii]|uniref:Uncharacterized protein n=1 Tax=Dyadobacter chenhuakuii TaxID=2909339 RepID=A0A9X1TTP2_9BACT|nr:hypothetical protein [Dyadobacter chenhuakuii]MCF2500424.1 hypothetical protein [Dyadobacter chenhuakuii]
MFLNLRFWSQAAVRFCRVFFAAQKEVHLTSLQIDKKGASGVVVRFQFENAIWTQIPGGAKTIKNEITLSGNDTSLAGKTLIVQGFFQRKSYSLSAFDPASWKLEPFAPRLTNLKSVRLGFPIRLNPPAISVRQKEISHQQHSIKINYSTFSNIDLL